MHFARTRGPPGAARHLGDRLCKTFGGAKIAGEKSLIGVQDDHQADIGKMVALGEHLGADQNARLAALTRSSTASMAPLAAAVSRSSLASGACGNKRRQCFFDALGALADRIESLAAAAASGGHRPVRTAVMTAQLRGAPVQGHARIAMLARARSSRSCCKTGSAHSRVDSRRRSPGRRPRDAARWPAWPAATSPRRRHACAGRSGPSAAPAPLPAAAAARAASTGLARRSPASRARASPNPARSGTCARCARRTARSRAE